MTTLVTDDFNRADEDPISGNWTPQTGSGRVVSNQFAGPSGGGESMIYWNAGSAPSNDQWSQITVTTAGTNSDWGCAIRCSTSALTCYFIDHFPSFEGLYKVVAGSYTNIAAGGASLYSTSDVLYIEAQGTAILCKINGSTDASVTDSSISSGRFGIFAAIADCRGDDYSAGDFAAGTNPKGPLNNPFDGPFGGPV